MAVHRARSLPEGFPERWARLWRRSLEDNPFLAPGFVLPALEHLSEEQARNPLVVAMESSSGELIGLGLFEETRGSRLLPLRHLKSWLCMHSFLDGMLLDRDAARDAADAFFSGLRSRTTPWHGVSFEDRSDASELSRVLEWAADGRGGCWREDFAGERAAATGPDWPPDAWAALRPSKRRKEVRRRRRRLEESGPLTYRVVGPGDPVDEGLELFLRLEAMGWKGEAGTALAVDPGQERFTRAMVENLAAEGCVLFPVLEVGDEPVAVGLMVRAGSTFFGFKSGYHTGFSHGSPGIQLKLYFLQGMTDFPDVTDLDSCAVSGSWVEPLWPGRRRVIQGAFAMTPAGRITSGVSLVMKRILRGIRSRVRR